VEGNLFAQITEQEATELAFKTHPQITLSNQQIAQQRALKKGSYSFNNPDLWVESPTSVQFAIGIQQIFEFPTVYASQAKLGKQNVILAEKELIVNQAQLKREVRLAYQNLQFSYFRLTQMRYQDSLYKALSVASDRRFNAGEAPFLEKVNAEARSREVHNNFAKAEFEFSNSQRQLLTLIGPINKPIVPATPLQKIPNPVLIDTVTYDTTVNPLLGYYRQSRVVAQRNLSLERSRLAPGVMLGYLNQGFQDSPYLYRFRFGITLPVWFWTYNSRIKAARIGTGISQSQYSIAEKTFKSNYQQAVNDYLQNKNSLAYYEESALKQADLIITTAHRSFEGGIIDFMTYMLSLNQAFEIRQGYYEAIRNYNLAVIQLNYLKGE
jgi:outer membrane protein TolC